MHRLAARYTEVELQLALLDQDIARGEPPVAEWDARLAALAATTHDRLERAALDDARRRLHRVI